MKNQYTGDINDYRKYGLLRCMPRELKLAVCWMLTDDDDRSDGQKIAYLGNPAKYRQYDGELFDQLQEIVSRGNRSVQEVESRRILPAIAYHSTRLTDDKTAREVYFRELTTITHDSELVFFDPDRGLEIMSVSKGKKGSLQYLYFDEMSNCYAHGQSVLVYQHLPRLKHRESFIECLAEVLINRFKAPQLWAFRVGDTVFILLPQEKHFHVFKGIGDRVIKVWHEEIKVRHFFRLKANDNKHYTGIIVKEETWYIARCPEIEVTTQGRTFEKAKANLQEAIKLYLESF